MTMITSERRRATVIAGPGCEVIPPITEPVREDKVEGLSESTIVMPTDAVVEELANILGNSKINKTAGANIFFLFFFILTFQYNDVIHPSAFSLNKTFGFKFIHETSHFDFSYAQVFR